MIEKVDVSIFTLNHVSTILKHLPTDEEVSLCGDNIIFQLVYIVVFISHFITI